MPSQPMSRIFFLKINVKGDGVNHTLVSPNPYLAQPERVMCFGVDVTYPPHEMRTIMSIVGVVSNIDQRVSKFIGSKVPLRVRQEIIENLKNMAKIHVNVYRERAI